MTLTKEKTICQWVDEQVKKAPEAFAFVEGAHRETYRELNNRANHIAGVLRRNNFALDDAAAVICRSAVETITAIFGIFKAGGTYLSLNPLFPPQYNRAILERGGATCLLTDENHIDFPGFSGKIIHLNQLGYEREEPPVSVSNPPGTTVIYTSNAAGKAEGMSLTQENLLNWLTFSLEKLKIDFSRTLFVVTPQIVSLFPLWWANLVTGGEIHFYHHQNQHELSSLGELTDHVKFKSIVCPLTFLKDLTANDQYRLFASHATANIVSVGEDVFDITPLKQFIKDQGIKWYNYFGFPMMNMVTTLVKSNGEKDFQHVGRLSSGTHGYILNSKAHLAPVGVTGELYLSGSGVMKGYHLNETLNRSIFVDNPVRTGARALKTGYTACWLPDGRIAVSGRNDRRVIMNGFPIAPQETELLLLKHPMVDDCTVAMRKGNAREGRLTTYVALKEDASLEQIGGYLQSYFPPDIFPIGLVQLASLPLTNNGEVDRNFLENLGIPDSLQVKILEEELSREHGIERTAIIVEEKIEKPVPMHLKDFLPGMQANKDRNEKEPAVPLKMKEEEPGEPNAPFAVVHGGKLREKTGTPQTLPEVLERAALEYGDKKIICIHSDDTRVIFTYSALLEEARRVLGGLKKNGLMPGDKAIFQFERNENFISAFWACVLGGFVPVPVTVPRSYQEDGNDTRTFRSIWETLGEPPVITDKNLFESIKTSFEGIHAFDIEELKVSNPEKERHFAQPDDMALLLFTSGSTGKPKGVIQSHHSILAMTKGREILNNFDHGDISVNWMPLEHVGGILAWHMKDVYLGCKQIHVRTEYILVDPLRWLDLIEEFKADNTWAPNFAYALVNERIEKTVERKKNWDLSSLRFMLSAGESINANSAKKFLKNLEPCALSSSAMKPGWGMSETCSGAVYSHSFTSAPGDGVHSLDKYSSGAVIQKSSSNGDGMTFVEVGRPIPGISLRIVGPDGQVVHEGVVGRFQVKGASVTPGYLDNQVLNREVFTPDGWFDTGDLGFIIDGRLTITGREKDVIIINGMNYSNVEIEACVDEIEGVVVSFTAACSFQDENSNTERLVIFFHSLFQGFDRKLEQIKKIRTAVLEKFALNAAYIIPLDQKEIPKTSIGKIQKTKLERAFLDGDFDHIIKPIDVSLENENTLPSWFFKISWKKQAVSLTGQLEPGRNCLVFMDKYGLGEILAQELEKRLCRCIKAKEGEDYTRLLETTAANNFRVDDIFFLHGFTPSNSPASCARHVREAQYRGLYNLLFLLKALSGISEHTVRLFIVGSQTRVITGNEKAGYENSTILGLLKSAAREFPGLKCCHIDLEMLPPGREVGLVSHVLNEWRNPRNTEEVAYRGGERYVPVLSRVTADVDNTAKMCLKNKGIYLVTGGLGGIGTIVSRWLMENYQARLVIVGRTLLPDRRQWNSLPEVDTVVSKRIRSYLDIESISHEFIYSTGDLCDESFMRELIRQAESRWGEPLSGIFHLAGTGNSQDRTEHLEQHRLVSETVDTFEEMFQSKVYGTMHLHKLIEDKSDTLFVAFSSVIGIFGAPGFGAYAAANRFLDEFCRIRLHQGYSNTYCLHWSAWDNVGMSENNPPPVVLAMRTNGYETISPRQGLHSLTRALLCADKQLVIGLDASANNIRRALKEPPSGRLVIKVFYSTQKKINIFKTDLHTRFLNKAFQNSGNKQAVLELRPLESLPLTNGTVDYEQLRRMSKSSGISIVEFEKPRTETEICVSKIWQKILDKSQPGINDNFFEIGGNSVKATMLVAVLHKELKVKMPTSQIFKTPTIRGLAQYVDSQSTTKKSFRPIEAVEKRDYYLSSSAQKRLYILQQAQTHSIAYNIPQFFLLEGIIERQYFQEIFRKMIQRHESLRTSFEMVNGESVQRIHENVPFNLDYYNMSQSNNEETDSSVRGFQETLAREFVKPFDLAQPQLIRAGLVKLDEQKHILMLDMHHIITDAISWVVFVNEFTALYGGAELQPLTLQYKDFSQWQRKEIASGTLKQQEEYWLKVFDGEIPVLNLPTDYDRSSASGMEGNSVEFEIDINQVQSIKKITLKEEATTFMVIFAIYNIFLSKICRQEDIIVGFSVAGREHFNLQHIIGMFINTLAPRNQVDGDMTFIEFLQRIKQTTLMAFENQGYPYDDLLNHLDVKIAKNRNPLFNTAFALNDDTQFQTDQIPEVELPQLKLTSYGFEKKAAKFDLVLRGTEADNKLFFSFEYRTALFKEKTIKMFADYFKEIAASLVENPNISLGDIKPPHSLVTAAPMLQDELSDFEF